MQYFPFLSGKMNLYQSLIHSYLDVDSRGNVNVVHDDSVIDDNLLVDLDVAAHGNTGEVGFLAHHTTRPDTALLHLRVEYI